MAYEVEVIGLKPFMADARRVGMVGAPRLVRAALVNSTNRIQSTARDKAPHRTGTLQRSILTQVDYPVGQVSVNVKYGTWIENGTGIYGPNATPIVPVRAKALYWDGQFFARSIKGMKPRPFFKPAIEESIGYIHDQFLQVINRIVHELAGHGGETL
jgi:HK97 gp10 family phage protein